MVAQYIAVPLCCSRFTYARYGSQMIDRFLHWGNNRNQKSGDIKGSCQPTLVLLYFLSKTIFNMTH